jgi:signal transduction histidine kinase/CHASE1-domain containing sensor protein/CheY-like chemotaxis protein
MSELKYSRKHIRQISIAIGSLCFLGTIVITVINREYEKKRWQSAFDTSCNDLTSTISSKINESINDLLSIQAFFCGSEVVTSNEFSRYSQTITDDQCIIGWAPKINVSDLDDFTNITKKYYNKDYLIHSGNFSPASTDFIIPVQYIKPLNKNLLGFDLNSASKELSDALIHSLETKKIVTADIDSLPIEEAKGWIVMLGNVSNNFPDESHKLMQGILFGIYFAKDIVNSTINSLTPRGINMELCENHADGSEEVCIKYNSPLKNYPTKVISVFPIPNLKKSKKISFGNKELIIHFKTVPAFFNLYTSSEPLLILLSGLILSILISYLVWHQSTNAIKIEEQVAIRTKELMESRQKLISSAEFLNNILDSFPNPIFVIDNHYKIKKANKAARTASKDFSRCCDIARTETESFPQENCAASFVFKTGKTLEKNIERKIDGELRSLKIVAAPFVSKQENQVVITVIDMTSEKKLNIKLLQSQKMEAIGQLAGGIAHDLNNVLQVIHGYAELALTKLDKENKVYEDILEIKKSGMRAAELTKSILAFGRKQAMEFNVLDLNKLITDFKKMLERVIPENISITFIQSKKTCLIEADANMLEQVLMNLCVNARDAMLPEGGKLLIRTERRKIEDAQFLKANELSQNEYVILSIQDSGTGIKKEVLNKIFEPFFTTKPLGKGTGLGLSTVFGIVKQHKGTIIPKSQLGKGTVFSVYIPASDKEISDSTSEGQKSITVKKKDNTVILLAEDNDDVRILNMSILKANKFHVILASNDSQAYELFKNKNELIDMIVLDVVIHEKSECDLYHKFRKINPEIPVLFLSGLTKGDIQTEELLKFKNIKFLQKPFTQKDLIDNINILLNMKGQ